MNEEHPQDYAQSRFAAFWMIVIALVAFVVALSFVLCVNSRRESSAANSVEDVRADKRFETLAAVKKEQQSLVNGAAVVDKEKNLVRIPVADGMKLVLPVLQNKKAGVTELVVPGSPTSLKPAPVQPATDEKKEGAKAEPKAPGKK